MTNKELKREHVDGGILGEIESRNHNWSVLQEFMEMEIEGVDDYNSLRNKPSINDTELVGKMGLKDIKVEPIENQDIKRLL